MEGAFVQGGATHDERYKWLVVFAIGGDLRFLSHHDTLRLFRRALARADFPVRFTEGFNPHPKIMIPLPRPVGIASRDEALVVETTREIDPETALSHIRKQTPDGIELLSLRRLVQGEQLEPQRVRYRLDVSDLELDDLDARIVRLLATTSIPIERISPKRKQARQVDIRPYLADLRADGRTVEFTLLVTGNGTAKPSEIAGALGCDHGSINHRIERLEVQWSSTPRQK